MTYPEVTFTDTEMAIIRHYTNLASFGGPSPVRSNMIREGKTPDVFDQNSAGVLGQAVIGKYYLSFEDFLAQVMYTEYIKRIDPMKRDCYGTDYLGVRLDAKGVKAKELSQIPHLHLHVQKRDRDKDVEGNMTYALAVACDGRYYVAGWCLGHHLGPLGAWKPDCYAVKVCWLNPAGSLSTVRPCKETAPLAAEWREAAKREIENWGRDFCLYCGASREYRIVQARCYSCQNWD